MIGASSVKVSRWTILGCSDRGQCQGGPYWVVVRIGASSVKVDRTGLL